MVRWVIAHDRARALLKALARAAYRYCPYVRLCQWQFPASFAKLVRTDTAGMSE